MFSAVVLSNALTITTSAGVLVIPAGTTLGTQNGVPFRLWVTNDGTLAAGLCTNNGSIKRPKKVLGSLTWEFGLPVAGQWSVNPVSEEWQPGDALPGDVLETVTTYSDFVSLPVNTITSTTFVPTTLTGFIINESAADSVNAVWNAGLSVGYATEVGQFKLSRGGLYVSVPVELGASNSDFSCCACSPTNDFPGVSGRVDYVLYAKTLRGLGMRFPASGVHPASALTLQRIKG